MGNLSHSDRWAFIFFFAGAFLVFLAWAFPNLSRIITIPLAIICACFMVYFAWPELKIAVAWACEGRRKTFTVISIVAIVIITMIGTYFYIYETDYSYNSSIQPGSIAETAPLLPKKLTNGNYTLQIVIKSVGTSPMLNFQVIFAIAAKPQILSMNEEGELLYRTNIQEIMNIVSTFTLTEDGVSRVLRPNSEYIENNPNAIITESQMEDVKSGAMHVYYFLIVAYQDSSHGPFYFGEYCGRLVPQVSAFARCWHENFAKRLHP